MTKQITYIQARTATEFEIAKKLTLAYSKTLNLDLSFQNFQEEIASLDTRYNGPKGALLIAEIDGQPAGVVAVHEFSEGVAELKRLYVDPNFRQFGLGAELVERIIAIATDKGYQRIRLDTLPTMTGAQKIYRALGFHAIEAYRYNPVVGTLFLEKTLA
ncbi:acetyltransferase [Secundilactobacillus paracollinoides]|uniref:Acetyltransferase n=1 Tax=Secundilactobacillus paracollinoides TaxID=240427 RepID=A0A1B2IZ19_9LACO|nr:GNAT family N-acetyltransferase [Secundilactobacillus paracollinoides]ANZ61338.1 acetyltransferase [Secundilactobacillus paracollinoides]ANZ64271.1 acetyltransferase [Secundilactobacillus paracollinoides]ANZ67259.1 acetyltransferase [Secundilactobacillus paracollinoides]KRL75387.1 acetyltransferase [Secundilactobacillus paracollinoides DSM 15502 = JCM 11969]